MSLVKNLKRIYSDFEIDIPEWEISDTGITALWWPSGAGKTSVFRLLIGLESCPQLSWMFKGTDLAKLSTPERRLGVVFQSCELFPHMTARGNILFAARARNISPQTATNDLTELSKLLQLDYCLGRKARVLSGGEQQRVALARALIGQPRFLFLDEPFSALDAELKSEARNLVKRVIHSRGIPTLLITHDKDDLSALADNVAKIRDGKLVSESVLG